MTNTLRLAQYQAPYDVPELKSFIAPGRKAYVLATLTSKEGVILTEGQELAIIEWTVELRDHGGYELRYTAYLKDSDTRVSGIPYFFLSKTPLRDSIHDSD